MGKNNQSKIRILSGEERLGAAARSSAFLAVEDFASGAEPILTIKEVGYGECVLDQGRREEHDVIFFMEASVPGLPVVRPMLVNSTNRKTLMAVYGDLSAEVLMGKRIRLYVDPRVRAVGGGTTAGIRIRKLVPPEPAQPIQTSRSRPSSVPTAAHPSPLPETCPPSRCSAMGGSGSVKTSAPSARTSASRRRTIITSKGGKRYEDHHHHQRHQQGQLL